MAIFFHEMEVHTNFFEDFDISNYDSKLLLILWCSSNLFKDEKLIWLSSIFDEFFTTDDSKVFFVLTFLNGQNLSDFTSLRFEERDRKGINFFKGSHIIESYFVSHGHDELICGF